MCEWWVKWSKGLSISDIWHWICISCVWVLLWPARVRGRWWQWRARSQEAHHNNKRQSQIKYTKVTQCGPFYKSVSNNTFTNSLHLQFYICHCSVLAEHLHTHTHIYDFAPPFSKIYKAMALLQCLNHPSAVAQHQTASNGLSFRLHSIS